MSEVKIRGLSAEGEAYRTALVAIQELHHIVYLDVDDEARGLNPMCNVCMRAYPCRTRRLADDALTARTTKNGEKP